MCLKLSESDECRYRKVPSQSVDDRLLSESVIFGFVNSNDTKRIVCSSARDDFLCVLSRVFCSLSVTFNAMEICGNQ